MNLMYSFPFKKHLGLTGDQILTTIYSEPHVQLLILKRMQSCLKIGLLHIQKYKEFNKHTGLC